MPEKFKLDFNIYHSEDRLESIKDIPLETLNQSELETISNYILYGKDKDSDTSIVDRKEVFIKPKFDTFKKEKTVSLEELMEMPGFDETIFEKNRPKYKKPKIGIDREKAKDIPGMEQLWEEIDRQQEILDQNSGKKELQPDTPVLSQKDLYLLRHYLIQLRTQQYYLWDSKFESLQAKKNKGNYFPSAAEQHVNYPILPRGVMRGKVDREFEFPYLDKSERLFKVYTDQDKQDLKAAGKFYLDFCDEKHVGQLILNYADLALFVEKMPDSLINNILWTLDFYIEKARLAPHQYRIIQLKKIKVSNKDITEILKKEFGSSYQENYISTIWSKAIKKIVEAVELNLDEFVCKGYDKAWKKCSKCGEILLRDPRNFVRKAKNRDGLNNQCKFCDKKQRDQKKAEKKN